MADPCNTEGFCVGCAASAVESLLNLAQEYLQAVRTAATVDAQADRLCCAWCTLGNAADFMLDMVDAGVMAADRARAARERRARRKPREPKTEIPPAFLQDDRTED